MKSTITFMIALTAIGLFGAAAYAVEVPVDEDRYDLNTQKCQEMEISGNLWCVWKPFNNSGYTGNQTNAEPGEAPILENTIPIVCPERFYLNEGKCLPIVELGVPAEIEYEPTGIKFFDKMEEDLRDNCADGCKPSDQKLLEVLENRDNVFCYDGDRTSIQIQSPGSTLDPDMEFNEDDNYNYGANLWLQKLALNEMKCRADDILDEQIHTEFHKHKGLISPFAKQNAIPQWIRDITIKEGIEYPKLDQENFDASNEAAKNKVCYNQLYGNNYKIQFGCPKDSLYKPTDHEGFYSYNGTTSKLNPIFDYTTQQNWSDYQRYMNGDHSQQLQKNIKVTAERDRASATNYGGSK